MPTPTGSETIGERLTRFRDELTRVRETLARHESNGQSTNIGGTSITEIAYERAQSRETKLSRQIQALEARLTGKTSGGGAGQFVTRMN